MSLKHLLAATALLITPGLAVAADLPTSAAPPTFVPPPIPVFTWSGVYAGLTAGAVDQQMRATTAVAPGTHLALPADLAAVANAGSGGADRLGFTGGADLGYNRQVGALVIGVEADAAYAGGAPSFTGAGNLANPARSAFSIASSDRTSFLATGRGRVGFAVDRALFFATGGVALADQRFSQTYSDRLFAASGDVARSGLRAGFAVGGGIEYAFSDHWSAKAEYLFARIDAPGAAYTIASRTGGTNVLTASGHEDLQIGRVGLNYHFDSVLPVVARY